MEGPIVTKPTRNSSNISIRTLDNGFLLNVNKDTKEGYESVELAITSLPKLLKAIATFLKDTEKEEAK